MGKITEINQISNRILKRKYEKLNIGNICEIGRKFGSIEYFGDCKHSFGGYAHDQKRRHYRLQFEDLGTVKHTLKVCNNCHDKIEFSKELTELVFKILRPEGFVEPMVKTTKKTQEKLKSKKPSYFALHKCKNCGHTVRGWLCPDCREVSV